MGIYQAWADAPFVEDREHQIPNVGAGPARRLNYLRSRRELRSFSVLYCSINPVVTLIYLWPLEMWEIFSHRQEYFPKSSPMVWSEESLACDREVRGKDLWCGKPDLVASRGEIALGLLPSMEKDQVLERNWCLASHNWAGRIPTAWVFSCGFLDPAVGFPSVWGLFWEGKVASVGLVSGRFWCSWRD